MWRICSIIINYKNFITAEEAHKIQPNSLTQSVLQVHNNSVGKVTDEALIIHGLRGSTGYKIAPMDPHHDGQEVLLRGSEVHT